MNNKAPRILFIPVSSPSGSGEYFRSLILADELCRLYPKSEVHFILNKNVTYKNNCPFQVHLSEQSATKNTPKVKQVIQQVKPHLVIFDCSGRGSQFKFAKRMGAKVVFISQHIKKRAKGLKLNRLLHCDAHWVVQPDYAISPLSKIERLKLKLFNKSAPLNVGPVLSNNREELNDSILSKYKLAREEYIIFSAGSGSHVKNGGLAADLFYSAALSVSKITKLKCVMVFGINYPKPLPEDGSVLCIRSLPYKEFSQLISLAKGLVVSAGDTLLQAISLKRPCVSVAVAKDQPHRLLCCANEKLVLAAQLNEDDILEKTKSLLEPMVAEQLQERMNRLTDIDGREIVIKGICELIES